MTHLSDNNILQYTLVAADALQGVAAGIGIPFLESVCSISLNLIPMIEVLSLLSNCVPMLIPPESNHFQRDRCLRMTEEIHKSLCALGALCLGSEDTRPPEVLGQIAQYARTLQAFHSYLKAQQDLGKIKRFFKQGEIITQLEVYEREVKQAANIFSMYQGVGLSTAFRTQCFDAESRHQEFLELFSAVSIDTSSLRGSSFTASRGSLSHLPASPKIFHGRDSELNDMIGILLADRPRVAILGPGGIGKTTLAMAALHNPVVIEKYNQRHFIPCESASSSADLASIMGSILGLELSKQLTRVIVRHFAESEPTLILLDNFETPWEPLESRAGVEEFISLLADIPTLALLITMRGAERPGKVKWSRPFLPVLEPLSKEAAHQVFVDIADEPNFEDQIAFDKLLDLSGGLPLAASLLASVASFEGYSGTLDRWNVENTSLLSDGLDKRLNLEKSIMLSLGSPRISSSAHTRELLSLLCLLPAGITETELVTSQVPVIHISQSKSTLLRTSLAYIDVHGRLKTLNPIRQYVRSAYPPLPSLYWPLVQHFQDLLHVWYTHQDLSSGDLVPHLGSHMGNIRELLLQGPPPDSQSEYLMVGHGIIELLRFMRLMLIGNSGDSLMKKLPYLIEVTGNSQLRWAYTCDYLRGYIPPIVPADAERLMMDGLEHFATVQSPVEEIVTFYNAVASHACANNINSLNSMKFSDFALSLAKQTCHFRLILDGLQTKFNISEKHGEYKLAAETAREAQAIGRLLSSFGAPVWSAQEAVVHVALGNLSRAFDLCEQAEAQLSRGGMKGTDKPLFILDVQADIHLMKSEYIEARKMHTRIASRTSPKISPKYHGNSLANIAFLDILTGSNETEICSSLDAAKAVYVFLGDSRIQLCDWVTAELYLLQGEIEQARSAFEQTVFKTHSSDIRRDCLASLADLKHGMSTLLATFRWAVVYLAFSRKSRDRVGTFQAFRRLADIFIRMDEEQTALELFRTGLEGATELDIHRLRAECMVGIGDIMVRRGDSGQAERMYKAAPPLFIAASRRKEASAVEERLGDLYQ
ncbi:hypothetical protein C8F04DRAFT_1391314 [Mycena alexandri]|uniref:Novel STAND NTPase 1 domain-containing protein n=1 Tax=Mycena alexandri TaxID=1745969 RepID=A0AAD6T7E7_9AGAR|nr:hypothetical protein C8F04DRAFT_1391314 [Mycena alexandri]